MTGRSTPTVPRPRTSPEATSTAGRPFWQTEPCPSWCTASSSLAGHQDGDDYPDRDHFRSGAVVPLSLYTAIGVVDVEQPTGAPWLTVNLSQHYRVAAPDVILCVPIDGDEYREHEVRLTVAEARQLVAALLDTLAELDATERGAA